MAKISQDFEHDIFRMLHKPIRDADRNNFQFLERLLLGPQAVWEEKLRPKIFKLIELLDPEKTPQPRLLKDHVGFTKELDNITKDISDEDLRKIISLAVALWKTKGLELGYETIIRVFTGANVRIFNWFDYRLIVGEKALGEEQLGEDSWFISTPGVEASVDPLNTVASLWKFEQNFGDVGLLGNKAIPVGKWTFFTNGPVDGSSYYLHLIEGYLRVRHSVAYDFSGDFTIEGFAKGVPGTTDGYLFNKKSGTKEVSIKYKPSDNTLEVVLNDGTNSETFNLVTGVDLDDDIWRHFRLVVDRVQNSARLYFNGSISTAEIDISAIGDLTNDGDIFIGAFGPSNGLLKGVGLDEYRICLNAVNSTALASILVPAISFIEFAIEQLDEFFTDIRVVDDGSGTLNRLLLKRIVNLMRPTSERIRFAFVKYSEDFSIGKGTLSTIAGTSDVIDGILTMQQNSMEIVDMYNADDLENIYFQAKVKIEDEGEEAGLVFNYQDANNYYVFKMKTGDKTFKLSKFVAGIETVLQNTIEPEIFANTDYILTVVTNIGTGGDQQIECKHDGNTIFNIEENTFVKGRFGFKTETGSILEVDEIEMFTHPLETDFILPGFEA